MKRTYLIRTLILTLFIFFGASSIQSCKKNASRTYKGKVKKGKPMPCPVKDC